MMGSSTRVLLRLLGLAAPFKWWMALAALLGFCTVGAGIGLMATSAYLISEAALHPSIAALEVAIVGVRFFGISRGIFRYLERYVSHFVSFQLLSRLRVWFYEAVEPLAPARLVSRRSGDLLARVISDIETLQDFYVRVIAPPVVAALVALLMWFLLGAYNPVFALALLGFYLLAGMGVPLLAHLLSRELGREVVEARAELNVVVLDGIQGAADIIAFGQENAHQARVERANRRLTGLQQGVARVTGLQSALGNLLMNLAMWTMLVVAVPLVRDGRLAGVYLAVVLLATLASFEAVLPLPAAAQSLAGSLQAARRLFEIVDARPAVADGSQPSPIPTGYGIEVSHLTFSYGPGEPPAVRDVTFSVPQGQMVALVGPSGAGKSTVANLLLRFWEYGEGSIKLGGHELRDYQQEDVRRMVSVLAQRTDLFNTTIRGNLSIARPEATEEELVEATRRAQLLDFVTSLPRAFDTQVGEQGLRLSGGERQRLAIARAFLKDAPTLILDEPTANLDTITEQQILRTVAQLVSGRTTLLITHRLVGLEMADEILVMREGRVVERGTHAGLIARDGPYRRMWLRQNEMLPAIR